MLLQGSGRAADIFAHAYIYAKEEESLSLYIYLMCCYRVLVELLIFLPMPTSTLKKKKLRHKIVRERNRKSKSFDDKTNKMTYAPSEDSDQPGHPPNLIRVFAVRMKKACILSYPLSAQRRLWSDLVDAQPDLSLRWAHSHFVGFVMRRLKWHLGKPEASLCICIRELKIWL